METDSHNGILISVLLLVAISNKHWCKTICMIHLKNPQFLGDFLISCAENQEVYSEWSESILSATNSNCFLECEIESDRTSLSVGIS